MSILDKFNPVRSHALAALTRVHPTVAVEPLHARHDLAVPGSSLPPPRTPRQKEDARKQELNQAVKKIHGYVQNISRELNFSVDEERGQTIVTVIDEYSGEVLRQIPSEDMMELARNLSESREQNAKGILFEGDA